MAIFLGTGASEGIPAAFCGCPVCERARRCGGRDVRSRSAFLIDRTSLIDPGPDIRQQVTQNGIDLRQLRSVFVTHTHEDHVSIPELGTRGSAVPPLGGTVTLYASAKAVAFIRRMMGAYIPPDGRAQVDADGARTFPGWRFTALQPFRRYAVDGLTVTPVIGAHLGTAPGEDAFNYLIRDREGRQFLYACDTGWYGDKTWAFFAAERPRLDYLVIECTYGTVPLEPRQYGHLDYANLRLMLDRFAELGCIGRDTPVYVTHICHLNTHSHAEMQAYLAAQGYAATAAYDGMRV